MGDIRLSSLILPPFRELYADMRSNGHSEYWLGGGRASGKSSDISLKIPIWMLRDRRANAIIYRKVASTLRGSVYEQMVWALRALGIAPWFHFRLSPLEIVCKATGQKIMFRGADDPNKSKSIKLAEGYFKFLWLEEVTEFDNMDEVRTIQASILRGGDDGIMLCSYNPPRSAQNWVNAEVLKPVPGRLVHHSDYTQLPPELLGKPFIATAEALRATNERAYRHMYLGEVTGTGGQVFDNLRIEPIPDEQIARFDRYHNGLDFGFAVDPDACVRCHYDKVARVLYLVKEYYAVHSPVEGLADHIQTVCGRETVTCDSADPRMINELRRRDINAYAAKKGAGSVEHGMRWLQELTAIVIDPARCPNAAREFAGYEYKQDRHGNFMADYPDKDNHTIDAVRYAVEELSTQRVIKTINKSALGL